ncbi:hypothetical protein BGZ76_007071 [Entomortierella beljakovae]|nr:hypothetical protein BGZ76_007071 [Entomortierella beljakovae]
MKGTAGNEQQQQRASATHRFDRSRRPQIRFQDVEQPANPTTTNARNRMDSKTLPHGVGLVHEDNSVPADNTRAKLSQRQSATPENTIGTKKGTGTGTGAGSKLDNHSSRYEQFRQVPHEDKASNEEESDFVYQGESLQEIIATLRNPALNHSRESSSSKKSLQSSSPKYQQERLRKGSPNNYSMDQSRDSHGSLNGKTVRYNDTLGLETPSDEDKHDGNEKSKSSPKYKTKREYVPIIDASNTGRSLKQFNPPLEPTSPTATKTTTKPAIERVSKFIDQDELEQRIQALRTSISALNTSTQQIISLKPLPKSQRTKNVEKSPVSDKPQQPPNGRILENRMPDFKDHKNANDSILSKDESYQRQPRIATNNIKLGHTAESYTHQRSYSNTEESLDERESFSSHSYSHSDEKTDEPDTRYGLQDIHIEIQRMRKEMEQSKMESKQLQQWILDRSSHSHTPVHTRNSSHRISMERPVFRSEYDNGYKSRPGVRSPTRNNAKSKYQLWKHVSRPSMETRESSESDEPFYSDSWRDIPATARVDRRRYGTVSTSDISSGMESEYRDPNNRAPVPISPIRPCQEKPKGPSVMRIKEKNEKNSILKRVVLWFMRTLFWLGFFVALQVIIMSLLFR